MRNALFQITGIIQLSKTNSSDNHIYPCSTVDAIDETIYPSVLGMTKCSIAFGRWPHAIEHLVIPSTSGQIVSSIA
jgi:hypothetical protein